MLTAGLLQPTSPPRDRDSRSLAWSLVVVGVAAFLVRALGVGRSFELWVDEMLYARLGESVAQGQLPTLPDGTFFLHPPGFFLLEGGVIRALGLEGWDIVDLTYAMRWINVVVGALTVVLIHVLTRLLTTPRAATVAAVVAIFDPFILRTHSRAFLECTAWAFALAGVVVLVVVLRGGTSARGRPWWLLGAGTLVGVGVMTKDIVLPLVAGPIAAAVFWRATLRARDALRVLFGIVVPYAVYLVVLGAHGEIPSWFRAKRAGLYRMTGFDQTTGFNSPGSPPLLDRLVDQVGRFGPSYVLLALCPIAGAVACLSARPSRRMLGLLALSAGLFGLFCATVGTFEEQYGYVVVLLAVPAGAVALAELSGRRRPGVDRAPWLVGALVLATVALGVRAEATTDDGFRQAQGWVSANLPATARLGVTNGTGDWVFADDPRIGRWASPRSLLEHDAQFVLTQSLPTRLGYGSARPELLGWLEAHAVPVFRSDGPTNGSTVIWFVPRDELAAGAASGAALPELADDL